MTAHGRESPGCAFYTVANASHFVGAVALLNSVRLAGHDEPVRLVDAGLTDQQRRLLSDHVELVDPTRVVPPVHLAPYGPQLRPAGVQIVVDADVIVTRPLTDLIESARAGRFVGFVNDPPNDERHFEEWRARLGVGPLRRRSYLNAGQFVFPETMNQRLLGPWIHGQSVLGLDGTRYVRRARLTDPFYFADQDVVNAVLSAVLDDHEVDIRPHELAPHPPFAGVRLCPTETADRQLCEYADGAAPPYFLHHTMAKPWLQATPTSVYSTLLERLLLREDVALRLEPGDLPLRLRPGQFAGLDRRRAHAQSVVRRTLRRRLGVFGIRTRLEDRRRAARR